MKQELQDLVVDNLSRLSCAVFDLTYQPRRKPLYGGEFGTGGFSLCSLHMVSKGLDIVHYMVMHEESGSIVSSDRDMAEAMAFARQVLAKTPPSLRAALFHRIRERLDEHKRQAEEQRKAELVASFDAPEKPSAPKSIPRRRRQIFEESGGKCHYCATELELAGKWHIEHRMPKALGGGNERTNLVASCTACNWKKRDRTDEEFIAQQRKEQA